MKFHETGLAGVYIIELEPIGDSRGSFSRFWCSREFEQAGLVHDIAQINSSFSAVAGTTRGLHFQHAPHAEAKIVSCIAGRAFDVAVDARPESPSYLQWFGTELVPGDNRLLYVPAGFAHGYQTLESDTRLLYMVSEFYTPGAENGFRHDDPAIAIEWPMEAVSMSEKDKKWPLVAGTVR